jgi:DNA-directed RNA polymerase specialized sigma24 family protein
MAAGKEDTPESAEALEELCRTYWYPIYVYIRRQGYDGSDAQDLTQGFFAHILSRRFLQRANPGKGRFRSFMLGSLRYFLADELAKLQAKKRGGGRAMVSMDAHVAEARYGLEPVDAMDAEKLFERRWATTLLERVLGRLEEESVAAGKSKGFELLREFLLGDRGRRTYQDVATELGMTAGAVKVAAHRMRQRYRELFREEIARTLANPAETEEEMRHVFAAIAQ